MKFKNYLTESFVSNKTQYIINEGFFDEKAKKFLLCGIACLDKNKLNTLKGYLTNFSKKLTPNWQSDLTSKITSLFSGITFSDVKAKYSELSLSEGAIWDKIKKIAKYVGAAIAAIIVAIVGFIAYAGYKGSKSDDLRYAFSNMTYKEQIAYQDNRERFGDGAVKYEAVDKFMLGLIQYITNLLGHPEAFREIFEIHINKIVLDKANGMYDR